MRERKEFMPSHNDSSNTEQVKLCRHIASQQLQLQDWKVCVCRLGFPLSGTRLRYSNRLNSFAEDFRGL